MKDSARKMAAPARANEPAKISPARAAAFQVLMRVAGSQGHSDELLHSHLTVRLSAEDRNLATALVMGVLRWQIALDARIASLLARPSQTLAPPVAISLRLGAFQLLHMDRIPAHAALNESVELCRAAGQAHAVGMVNAVLRKVTTSAGKPVTASEAPQASAERLAHPQWLIDRWVSIYGRETTLAICEYDQHQPPEGSLFAGETAAGTPEILPQMDDGSRLVAEIAAGAVPSHAAGSPRVWDTCAAPGGKTVVLAARLPAADIFATDVSAVRLSQMQRRVQDFPGGGRVRCEVLDAAAPSAGGSPCFDLILCDVPCSGTGTLARNPEIRLRLRPEHLDRQAARQRAILHAASQRLAPGGRLVYSTCSLEPEENEGVVAAVASKAGLRQIPAQSCLAGLVASRLLPQSSGDLLLKTAVRDGCIRTLPGIHPCDGFYAAVLERGR